MSRGWKLVQLFLVLFAFGEFSYDQRKRVPNLTRYHGSFFFTLVCEFLKRNCFLIIFPGVVPVVYPNGTITDGSLLACVWRLSSHRSGEALWLFWSRAAADRILDCPNGEYELLWWDVILNMGQVLVLQMWRWSFSGACIHIWESIPYTECHSVYALSILTTFFF
jgi:hypothetical protein